VAPRIESFMAADAGKCEAGGILLGLRRDPHLEIVDATLPARGDVRQSHRFIRRSRSHQLAATRAWRQSGQLVDYLGEWHSHPEPHPSPSAIDESEMLRRSREHRSEALVELIVGYEGIWVALADQPFYVPLISA
jgi:integrative and conjugative element protein (TIGR02256 family)